MVQEAWSMEGIDVKIDYSSRQLISSDRNPCVADTNNEK